ncbi:MULTISPECIES: hypothetical protein [unclassified Coleofasciculus]|uniref:hypothetical protein n=1 Tax=unclassified Coleofasciculus TaxID=2692782 RepID=UPI0018828BA3|nr:MULTISPECIES: hypothetical protein [unclassified Coleofasciculus]MBE9129269.1 hypothetical protein [Coleofasciculus sp. LEGE 07081]MBE9147425.1 hypothetical protein [Coleofasciculus sp. LEGE 07092]
MLRRKQGSWFHLTALFFVSILVGWLLSDYNAHWIAWAGTTLITLHLALVGADAVAVAVTWVVGVVWAGAIAYAWPETVRGSGIAVWAGSLALGWFLGLALVLTLAFARRAMARIDTNQVQAFLVLATVTGLGLKLGQIMNSSFLPGSGY